MDGLLQRHLVGGGCGGSQGDPPKKYLEGGGGASPVTLTKIILKNYDYIFELSVRNGGYFEDRL